MMDYSGCDIEEISIHKVGNKTNEEDLICSKSMLEISNQKLHDLLIIYFLKSFPDQEYYNFTFSNEDFSMNPLYNYVSAVFDDPDCFHINSINIAKHLYEVSTHPNIKSGDLFVARFTDLIVNDDVAEVIGIFKSENRQSFLQVDKNAEDYYLKYEDGINIDKLDKGCLIFNLEKEKGYRIAIIDKANKAMEAHFWRDTFLNLKACSDDYNHTKEFLNLAKDFVTKQVSEEFEISKADKIDLLNKSVEYFKSNESFNKGEFEKEVFANEELIESFHNFDNTYREEHQMSVVEDFDISDKAVKKQARTFKSVLKLDKNFHIYIHGDKNLIEQGQESDGRKFYKIYYDTEQ